MVLQEVQLPRPVDALVVLWWFLDKIENIEKWKRERTTQNMQKPRKLVTRNTRN